MEASRYNPHMTKNLADMLFAWYSRHGRDLPWRKGRDPYKIWVSEVMLQQTRVDTVIPYYERWMEKFPDLETFVDAEIGGVLRLWEGMGYYRRVHNMQRTAQVLTAQYDGRFPRDVKELQRLPGIGPYTAAAIAAIAFNLPTIALDGNLRRVISRLFDYDQDVRSPEGEEYLVECALALMPSGTSSTFNQALMDLGAMICTPRGPDCETCPVASFCMAYKHGVQDERPLRRKRDPIPHHIVIAGVLEREGKVLIGQRPNGKLLGGLWEFPGGKCGKGETLEDCLLREWREELDLQIRAGEVLGEFSHAYTHFRVTVHAMTCHAPKGEPKALEHSQIRWVRPEALGDYPMGKVDREIAKTLLEAKSSRSSGSPDDPDRHFS
jgi:A/G-specific adenine glycosylase